MNEKRTYDIDVDSVGVVLNPSKLDNQARFEERIRSAIEKRQPGASVHFYPTTVEDPGFGQAKQAVADGCSVIIAAGGDGTVRLVAAGIADSDAHMGIIPMGTGNLFARNISVPLEDIEGAIEVALEGTPTKIDLGWLGHGDSQSAAESAEHEPFLVIAGYGFDAVVMERADSRLKKYVGWLAYVVAGAPYLVGRGQEILLELDRRRTRPLRARTVMIGNVGRLPGGFTIMPGADASNGSLEILALDWKGAAGFGQIVTELVAPEAKSLARISAKRTFQARRMRAETAKPLPVQVDGDYLSEATHLHAHVQPHALTVRTPETTS